MELLGLRDFATTIASLRAVGDEVPQAADMFVLEGHLAIVDHGASDARVLLVFDDGTCQKYSRAELRQALLDDPYGQCVVSKEETCS